MFSSQNSQVSSEANFIEDVFSTYLYTGNDSTQTITNGIDLAGKGGLVWFKKRSATGSHYLFDTVRGNNFTLNTNQTFGQGSGYSAAFNFASTGFTLAGDEGFNASANTYTSWTFREQPKFFDVVTYTGNGANNRQIPHNLGSAPGCIILKRTDGTGDWWTYHRSLGDVGGFSYDLQLNTTSNRTAYQIFGTGATQTSTYFTLGTVFAAEMNGNGATYVAYLFAHDAGGFGLTGTDNVISCGSFTTDGSGNATVNLGYEPQWVLYKPSATTSNWYLMDIMRGMSITSGAYLFPNASSAEGSANYIVPNATGFTIGNWNVSETSIYIAIRRGPMKTPTTGTSVFKPTFGDASTTINVGFPPDINLLGTTSGDAATNTTILPSRLIGNKPWLRVSQTSAESTGGGSFKFDLQNSFFQDQMGGTKINWFFRRAPGFFDQVCYTGDSTSGRTVTHNLAVAPELIIVKSRNTATNWAVYCQPLGNTKRLILNLDVSDNADSSYWNNTSPTSSVFYVGNSPNVNTTSQTYVAYLFATCPGVSKVGSYTGTGALQTINCGFAAGARFVLIKRTDSTGDWYVWDSARGISSGNDPYLTLNTTAAEVTGTNYVDTTAVGFQVTAAAPAAINASGGTYIFLAIA